MKALVLNPFGIGDVIFSFPLVEGLRFYKAEVDFLCNERTEELVRMNPSVRRHFVFNRDRFRELWRTDRKRCLKEAAELFGAVRAERYDVAFDLSMGKEYAFFLMLAGVRRRIGFHYRGRGLFLTDKFPVAGFDHMPVREYYSALLEKWRPLYFRAPEYPDLDVGGESERLVEEWRRKNGIGLNETWAVMAPGGGKSWGKDAHYKQWSEEKFAETARHLAARHGFRIVLMGGGDEAELCDKVRMAIRLEGAGIVMAGANLRLAAAVLKKARIFIGNDGGLLHLADLLRVPLVGIYGPVSEKVYGPGGKGHKEVLVHDVPCRPCYHHFRFPPCPYEKRCLTGLETRRVIEAADRILGEKSVKETVR